jgi:alkylated DNA repair dioxygenase AlkB
MEGIVFKEDFIRGSHVLFEELKANVAWDESMTARKTASFGVAYNYSQMSYPFQEMPPKILEMCAMINDLLGFTPNNCLVNYYLDGKSKMGFHSDQTDILEHTTGIAIVSLGETRVLRFKKIIEEGMIFDYLLPSGSLLYMTLALQTEWVHAIPKSETENGRMSLTFRKIK